VNGFAVHPSPLTHAFRGHAGITHCDSGTASRKPNTRGRFYHIPCGCDTTSFKNPLENARKHPTSRGQQGLGRLPRGKSLKLTFTRAAPQQKRYAIAHKQKCRLSRTTYELRKAVHHLFCGRHRSTDIFELCLLTISGGAQVDVRSLNRRGVC